jgi:tetratricopeptide (TPR) repeat protein
MTLADLHDAIQISFGWWDSHLHAFEAGGESYVPPFVTEEACPGALDEKRVTLRKLAERGVRRFAYEYDFGDSWRHTIEIQKALDAKPGEVYPKVAGGKRACPPEDCGGVWGYEEMLEALAGEPDEEAADLLDWASSLGWPGDPEAFDLAFANRRMAEFFAGRKWKTTAGPAIDLSKKKASRKAASTSPALGVRANERTMAALSDAVGSRGFANRAELESFIHGFLETQAPYAEPETPRDAAQELIFEAEQIADPAKRVEWARKAIELDEDCSEAWAFLAGDAEGPAEALPLCERAVEAAERTLGPGPFKDAVGHFWGVIETRPYMRARFTLALTLWELERPAEAIRHVQDLLRLCPSDNLGARYELLSWFLQQRDTYQARKLLRKYPDDCTANWAYGAALHAFQEGGDSTNARRALEAARKANPHVPHYFVGIKKLPAELPDHVGIGDESEAAVYVVDNAKAWDETPGAVQWLIARLLDGIGPVEGEGRQGWHRR